MYHSITESTHGASSYFETNTSPAVFRQHLQLLRTYGYSTVPLIEATRLLALEDCESLGKRVVITFDDGFYDFYSTAAPTLDEFGFSATVFVISDNATGSSIFASNSRYLGWTQICDLVKAGFEIGSHTVSHAKLQQLNLHEMQHEIGQSKAEIEQNIGTPIETFSYPQAFPEHDHTFATRLVDVLGAAGYRAGVTTILGSAVPKSHRFMLPRLPMNTFDDEKMFTAKLEGAYDWLHLPQLALKVLSASH